MKLVNVSKATTARRNPRAKLRPFALLVVSALQVPRYLRSVLWGHSPIKLGSGGRTNVLTVQQVATVVETDSPVYLDSVEQGIIALKARQQIMHSLVSLVSIVHQVRNDYQIVC